MGLHSEKKSARQLSKIFEQNNILDIVISPGSRNAPLIIEFTNNSNFKNYSIVDERSAGFFALGIAQQKQKPVVLVCTSGSALLNYYPAIAEAFYSRIPLIIVSADRPQKWVDQGEGQTIRQQGVFRNHSYYNVTLHENEGKDYENEKLIQEAVKLSMQKKGPVHINIPFDEPLYNILEEIENIETPPTPLNYEAPEISEHKLHDLLKTWKNAKQIMILAGQLPPSDVLTKQLEKLNEDARVIILTENISNQNNSDFITHIDQNIFLLSEQALEELKPDLLITIGRNLISKKIKKYLRSHKPENHWHVEHTDYPPNTFEALSEAINTSPEMFFSQFLFLTYDQMAKEGKYKKKWLQHSEKQWQKHTDYIKKVPFSDLKVFDFLSKNIPDGAMIQWGNSSSIRYAQFFKYNKNTIHFANRGTSGIDGSSSTAIGASQINEPTFLITGDISFFYDSNALWNKYLPDHFKIVLINNGGGDIFNFIPGPSKTKALDEFFVSKHQMHAESLARQFKVKYNRVDNYEDLNKVFPSFVAQKEPQILEINTQQKENHHYLKNYFKYLFD